MAQPITKQSSSVKTSDEQKQKNLSKVSYGADKKVRDQAYNDYVESITPKHNLAANMTVNVRKMQELILLWQYGAVIIST